MQTIALEFEVTVVTDTRMDFKVIRVEGPDKQRHAIGDGSINWSGCMDIQTNMHFCAPEEADVYAKLVRGVYALAEAAISEWEGP